MTSRKLTVHTYEEVANRIKIFRCNGCPQGDHYHGWADMSSGVIHWQERKIHRRGLRNYLKLAASIIYSHNRGQPLWLCLYQQNTWAYNIALMVFRVRLRSSYSDTDRARALYSARNEKQLYLTHPAAYRWMHRLED